MSFMETIRSKGQVMLTAFLVIFAITLFFGLTGGFDPTSLRLSGPDQQTAPDKLNLIQEGALKEAAMLVNGQPVSNAIYEDIVGRIYENLTSGQKGDESQRLDAYGYAVGLLAGQEVKLQHAKKLGVRLSEEDFRKEKTAISASFMPAEQSAGGGNVIGDVFKKANTLRAQKAAFSKYLATTGLTEAQWEAQVRRELLAQKVQDQMTEQAKEEEKAELDKRKAEVDAELAKGTAFSAVSEMFNDDKAQGNAGGDIGWIGYGLLADPTQHAQRDALFSTEKGKVTDWIENEAGWLKCEIYDKKEASGPEFEKEKEALRQRLLDQHKGQADYKPSDEEIAHEYEQVAVRQIMLRRKAEQNVSEELGELAKAARIEVNNAYALAYQALKGDRLQPPSAMSYDALVKLAQTAAIGEGYDFSPIKGKLKRGEPEAAKAEEQKDAEPTDAATDAATDTAAETQPAAEGSEAATASAAEEGADAAPADAAATEAAQETAPAEAEAEPAVDEVNMSDTEAAADEADPSAPIYALGIALLEKGIKDSNSQGDTSFAHYIIAKTYMDWLGDDERLKKQPINRDKAREAIELHLKATVESQDYNAMAFALRGLNLAWLEKKTEAYESLEKAQKFAADKDMEVWDRIKEAYEVFDDQTKLAEIDAKLTKLRQEQLQEMLNQSMQKQQSQAPPPSGQ